MMNWTSSFSIWRKPNRVLLSPHHLRSPGFSQRRISPMILFGDISSLMRFRRALGVRLFSQREYHSPVLEFLVLWSYSIDGLSLQSLQVDIIICGSCLVQIRNRQKIPPWPFLAVIASWYNHSWILPCANKESTKTTSMARRFQEMDACHTWRVGNVVYNHWVILLVVHVVQTIATHLVYSKSFPSRSSGVDD